MAENVKEVVPFLGVLDMARSVPYYTKGLGFAIKRRWDVDGELRWCWLTLGGASIMLQQWHASRVPKGKPGDGMSLCFQCEDALALYHQYRARDLAPTEPSVGNGFWVTQLVDPDGYNLFFESPTDTPEETKLSDLV